jgi:aminoglycoside/choline kinase family phosphotransferase
MSNQAADAVGQRQRIDAYLDRNDLARRTPHVVPLTGDASDRKYYRVLVPDAPSIVLSLYSAPFDIDTLSFVNVARLLEQMPVPIPTVLGHAGDLGVLALEDLGDVTLQAHLGAVTPAEHAARYRQAVALIATLQRRGAELESPVYLPYGIAFDVEKLTWEMDFFTKHFIEAYRGVVIGEAGRQELHQAFGELIAELTAEPRVLCHRDYHSRNLMLHHDRLYIIDFQDARMGPDTYDLVSLLRDSYVDLPEPTVDELIAYFLALKGQTGTEVAFRKRFDAMALQRNLKALGTFGYQTTARRNPVYIQYIPRTLRYVRDNLEHLPQFARLRELLAAHVEEFR